MRRNISRPAHHLSQPPQLCQWHLNSCCLGTTKLPEDTKGHRDFIHLLFPRGIVIYLLSVSVLGSFSSLLALLKYFSSQWEAAAGCSLWCGRVPQQSPAPNPCVYNIAVPVCAQTTLADFRQCLMKAEFFHASIRLSSLKTHGWKIGLAFRLQHVTL